MYMSISGSGCISTGVCSRNMDSAGSGCKNSGSFPHAMSTSVSWHTLVRLHPERRSCFSHRSSSHHGPHLEPSMCTVRPHRPSTRVRPGQALRCHVDASLVRPPQHTWRRRPGRPRNSWLEQIRQDSGSSPADLWRRAVIRGHERRYGPGWLRR